MIKPGFRESSELPCMSCNNARKDHDQHLYGCGVIKISCVHRHNDITEKTLDRFGVLTQEDGQSVCADYLHDGSEYY